MRYAFPIIRNISDVLPAIAGRDEFIIAERPGYKIVNYLVNYITTFEDPSEQGISDEERLFRAIRRECRGVAFCSETGRILRRPLSKFFNLNEKPETSSGLIDVTQLHVVLDKLDGSFIAPFYVNERMIYGTKMGDTDVSQMVYPYLEDKPQFNKFNDRLIRDGFSPIYEFVSPNNRIVISYPKSELILLAIRNMVTGEYHAYDDMRSLANADNIPVVRALPGSISSMETFVSETKSLSGAEGYVIRFSSGMQLKMKADDYVLRHRAKDQLSQEKNLVELIVTDQIDDFYSTLTVEDSEKVKRYADSMLHHISKIAKQAEDIVAEHRPLLNNEKKRFALEIIPNYRDISSVLFSVWDGKDALAAIKKMILNNCGTQTKIDSVRKLLGDLKWNDVYTSAPDLDG